MVVLYALGALLVMLALDGLITKLFARPFWFVIRCIAWVAEKFIKPEPPPVLPVEEWVDYRDEYEYIP